MMISVVAVSVAFAAESAAPAASFPFLGEVNANRVNVRSGHSADFEKIAQLFNGEKVIVFAEDSGWYKIRLPRTTETFISKKYIKVISKDEGVTIGERVNVRSGAGVDFPVITQLDAGTTIHILESAGDWYKFEPLTDLYGWVSKGYVTFKSADTGELQQGVIFTRASAPAAPSVDEAALAKKVESKTIMTFTGVLERQEPADFKDVRFKLVNGDATVCFLTAAQTLVDDFLHYKVEVQGAVYEDESRQYPFPMVHVQKIQLVL